jgi:hypothetical protein
VQKVFENIFITFKEEPYPYGAAAYATRITFSPSYHKNHIQRGTLHVMHTITRKNSTEYNAPSCHVRKKSCRHFPSCYIMVKVALTCLHLKEIVPLHTKE